MLISGQGRLHRGRHVRLARAPRPRDPGGLRDGRCQDYAEGLGEEHVHQEALQVKQKIFSCWYFSMLEDFLKNKFGLKIDFVFNFLSLWSLATLLF